jgi:hypothetical protein
MYLIKGETITEKIVEKEDIYSAIGVGREVYEINDGKNYFMGIFSRKFLFFIAKEFLLKRINLASFRVENKEFFLDKINHIETWLKGSYEDKVVFERELTKSMSSCSSAISKDGVGFSESIDILSEVEIIWTMYYIFILILDYNGISDEEFERKFNLVFHRLMKICFWYEASKGRTAWDFSLESESYSDDCAPSGTREFSDLIICSFKRLDYLFLV